MPAAASPAKTAGRLLNSSTRVGSAQPAPAITLAMPRPRCTPQASSIKITEAAPSGSSQVHGYGSRRRDCCDIGIPSDHQKGPTSIPAVNELFATNAGYANGCVCGDCREHQQRRIGRH
jgi:hypothetical protein